MGQYFEIEIQRAEMHLHDQGIHFDPTAEQSEATAQPE
jgi:hypothetical protein